MESIHEAPRRVVVVRIGAFPFLAPRPTADPTDDSNMIIALGGPRRWRQRAHGVV